MVSQALSQLAATVTTDRPPVVDPSAAGAGQEVSPQTFSQVRTALIKALRTSPEAREPLCDALELLETIQQKLEEYRVAMPPAREAAPKARNVRKLQEYRIHAGADGEFLVERRPGHSQPFRCPRACYDAAAEVLASAEETLHFDELAERLNARMGERQPDYRLRVALRFWLAGGAVLRSRTKYRAAERRAFPDAARSLWDNLAGK